MKHTITLKDLTLEEAEKKVFNKHLDILNKKLISFSKYVPKLSVFIKKHDKNHFYSGQMILNLPGKSLIAHMGEHSVEELVKDGFEKIKKELKVYKEKHFKSDSKYPNHSTIRIPESIKI